jgi:diguanylate cyclase (GGDEF)-like protein/PAS domain S-box-containing protein
VNASYSELDKDYAMLENSLELISHNLVQENSGIRATFEQIINSSLDGVLAFNEELRFTVWNPGMSTLTGIGHEKAIGKRAVDIQPLFQMTGIENYLREAVSGRTVVARGVPYFKSKSIHGIDVPFDGFFDGHFSPLKNSQGFIVGGFGIIRDITEQMLARENLMRLATFPEQNPNAIIEIDRNGGVTYANLAVFKTFLDFKTAKNNHPILAGVMDIAARLRESGEVAVTREIAIGPHIYEQQISLSIENYLIRIYLNDITHRKNAEEKIQRQAHYDSLTGLPNRILFIDRLNQALAATKRHTQKVGVLFLDLDRFKQVNDTLGHTVGDALLQKVAKRLESAIRDGDTVSRLGGDEFGILLVDINRMEDVIGIAQKVLNLFLSPIQLKGHEIYITSSIGISVAPGDGNDSEGLLRNSDTAMYRAKEQGRNLYQFFVPEMNVKVRERLSLETAMRQMLQDNQLILYYQPLVDLQSGQVIGMEALMRWRHPKWGLVSPAQFIPLAEDTGLILPMGEYIIKMACTQIKRWHDDGFPNLHCAVNVSARQFQRNDLLQTIENALKESRLTPSCLEIELTESIFQSSESTVASIRNLRTKGVEISIDDFGTGYSSLSYLKRFSVNKLKIDRSFVQDIATDADDRIIVKTIINLAHNLRLKVIAEGVETREQLDFLREQGCDEIQGYLFSPPLPVEQATELLRQSKCLN